MVVRIKLRRGRPIQKKRGKNRRLASAVGTLLIPAALMAYLMGAWRLASDVGIAGEFAITGLFSHWQVWIALAVTLHIISSSLNRYGRGGDLNVPSVLTFKTFSSRPENPPVPQRKVRAR